MRNGVLGLSAILAAVAWFGGTAAAAPAEYVRVCDAYGQGWYYIPGSETCLKPETGETRTETEFGTYYGQTDLANRLAESEAAVADLQRRFDAAFQDQSDSSSIAAALADPDLVAGEHFGVKFNWGNASQSNAFGVTFAGVIAERGKTRVTLSGGVATTGRNTGGRAGLQFSW